MLETVNLTAQQEDKKAGEFFDRSDSKPTKTDWYGSVT